ncbi:hypothetical protein IHE45_05G139400 [Dioscorea alata]|uniref:Uncharacterized protein n=1 Tax=Dioscorea alata TaxID=55571 RepID=A0ACB7W575_DIOAL|nr:hypothetical protein IHE45_05G139400 [Dioscorea alata]
MKLQLLLLMPLAVLRRIKECSHFGLLTCLDHSLKLKSTKSSYSACNCMLNPNIDYIFPVSPTTYPHQHLQQSVCASSKTPIYIWMKSLYHSGSTQNQSNLNTYNC